MADTDVVSLNSESSHLFCETTTADYPSHDGVGISLRKKPMAVLSDENKKSPIDGGRLPLTLIVQLKRIAFNQPHILQL